MPRTRKLATEHGSNVIKAKHSGPPQMGSFQSLSCLPAKTSIFSPGHVAGFKRHVRTLVLVEDAIPTVSVKYLTTT